MFVLVATCNITTLLIGNLSSESGAVFHLTQSDMDQITSSTSITPLTIASTMNPIVVGDGNFSHIDATLSSTDSISFVGTMDFASLTVGDTSLPKVLACSFCYHQLSSSAVKILPVGTKVSILSFQIAVPFVSGILSTLWPVGCTFLWLGNLCGFLLSLNWLFGLELGHPNGRFPAFLLGLLGMLVRYIEPVWTNLQFLMFGKPKSAVVGSDLTYE